MRTAKQAALAAPKLVSASRVPRLISPNRALVDAMCRTDFASFVQRSFHSLRPGRPFFPNGHIYAVAFHLEQVRRGKIRRLIINMPPRSLKSLMTSVAFPAYVLGLDPAAGLIVVSYSSEIAAKHSNDFRAIVASDWYSSLFARMRISQFKNSESEVCTTRGGFRLSTSIDGTLTGRGGDIIVIDDPLKPMDALSDPKRDRVNQWYANSLLSRLDDKQSGAIVIVMQRLHVEDLTGSLLKRGSADWVHLNLPAIAEQNEQIQISDEEFYTRRAGDPLHPEREPIAVLEKMRAELGADTFAAQYQQCPIPQDGAMIRRSRNVPVAVEKGRQASIASGR
jgi:hypothetical protein